MNLCLVLIATLFDVFEHEFVGSLCATVFWTVKCEGVEDLLHFDVDLTQFICCLANRTRPVDSSSGTIRAKQRRAARALLRFDDNELANFADEMSSKAVHLCR